MTRVQLGDARRGRRHAPGLAVLEVLDAAAARHAAAPTLRFRCARREPTAREVYTVALTAQIHIDPARRAHDDETRERLVDLFGEPERWAATTTSIVWAQARARSCRASPARPTFELPRAVHLRPRGRGHEVPLRAARTARCRSRFHFTGTVFYRGDDGRMQVVLVPWTLGRASAAGRDVAADDRPALPGRAAGSGCRRTRSRRLQPAHGERGSPTFDAASPSCWTAAR